MLNYAELLAQLCEYAEGATAAYCGRTLDSHATPHWVEGWADGKAVAIAYFGKDDGLPSVTMLIRERWQNLKYTAMAYEQHKAAQPPATQGRMGKVIIPN